WNVPGAALAAGDIELKNFRRSDLPHSACSEQFTSNSNARQMNSRQLHAARPDVLWHLVGTVCAPQCRRMAGSIEPRGFTRGVRSSGHKLSQNEHIGTRTFARRH